MITASSGRKEEEENDYDGNDVDEMGTNGGWLFCPTFDRSHSTKGNSRCRGRVRQDRADRNLHRIDRSPLPLTGDKSHPVVGTTGGKANRPPRK